MSLDKSRLPNPLASFESLARTARSTFAAVATAFAFFFLVADFAAIFFSCCHMASLL